MPLVLHPGRTAAALALSAVLLCPLSAQLIHSPQVNLPHREKPEDLSWLAPYAEPTPLGRSAALLTDPLFVALLRKHLTAPQAFWGTGLPQVADKPLAAVAETFLAGPPATVTLTQNRYFNVTGSVTDFPANRGLLWIDLGLPHPLLLFSALDWISDNRSPTQPDAAWSLWLFPSRALDPHQLPAALTSAIATWTSTPASNSTVAPNVTRVFLIDPDGTPHPLAPATVGAHSTLPPETSDTTKVPS